MRVELGEVVDIQIGYQVTGRAAPAPDGTHLIVQISDVGESGEVCWGELTPVVPSGKDARRYELLDGDVLFLAKGSRRLAAAVRDVPARVIPASTFYILRPRDLASVVPEYLAWYLNEAAGPDLAAREMPGSTMTFVRKGELMELPIDLPDLSRQHAIAALAGLLRKEEELIERLLERRSKLVNALGRRVAAGKEVAA